MENEEKIELQEKGFNKGRVKLIIVFLALLLFMAIAFFLTKA